MNPLNKLTLQDLPGLTVWLNKNTAFFYGLFITIMLGGGYVVFKQQQTSTTISEILSELQKQSMEQAESLERITLNQVRAVEWMEEHPKELHEGIPQAFSEMIAVVKIDGLIADHEGEIRRTRSLIEGLRDRQPEAYERENYYNLIDEVERLKGERRRMSSQYIGDAF